MQKYKNEENEKMKILLQQIITGISIGSIYALIASGYALVYSLLDFSNWAHGEVCMLGAYVCFMATTIPNMPYWLSCLLGIGGAAVISFLNEKIAYRKIRNNGSPNMFLMIAAMGLSTTYQNLAFAELNAKLGRKPCYLGYFTYVPPGADCAHHSVEHHYVFQTLNRSYRPYTGRDWDLSNELADYWANFMKTGNPNYEGKETWKPYEGGAYNVLEIAGEERRMISLADKTDIIQKAKELEEGK